MVINNSHLSIKFMCEVENMIIDIKEKVQQLLKGDDQVVEKKDEKKKQSDEELYAGMSAVEIDLKKKEDE